MHYFIHGKIYFIVDEIDSCEPSTVQKKEVRACTTKTLWWTVFGTNFGNQNQSGETIFAAKIVPPDQF